MEKKMKLSDLKDQTTVLKIDEQTKNVTRVSLEDMKDLTRVSMELKRPAFEEEKVSLEEIDKQKKKVEETVKPRPIIPEKKKAPKKIEAPLRAAPEKKEIITPVFFKRSLLKGVALKSFSLALVLAVLDAVYYFSRGLDGEDTAFDLSGYESFILSGGERMLLAKGIIFIIVTFVLTPKAPLVVTEKGIYCHQVSVMKLFYVSSFVFIPWTDIESVTFESRFFEPFMFFFGKNKEVIGQVNFSLESAEEFYSYVKQHAGKEHPVVKAKNQFSFF